ncbi:MAG: 50S ribosomal protein L9 [Geodermatophilaceae bacterium]|jgi:large subunit ribosomal protein L9|nr:50S ribosomal protein L9 [Geodermatophilaceae bacterium]
MRLILTQEVSGLGTPGDVVEVKDGYGRNYLMPRGLAITATRGAEKQIATIRRAREVREVRDVGQANDIKKQLEGLAVRLSARTGAGVRLFGSVTAGDIAEAVIAAGGPALDRRRIELSGPIKSTGSHQVSVRIHDDVIARVDVEVVPA